MENDFYCEWSRNRIEKIKNIFGLSWFSRKTILELGACQGDIGLQFLNLGSDVVFSDFNTENLEEISKKTNIPVKICEIDQNYDYDIERKFDLVLHLGLLCHIKNWKNDLKCALNHSNVMVLETLVNPNNNQNSEDILFTENMIEEHLSDLNCKFIRFDNSELNADWRWSWDNIMIRHEYDWNSKDYENFDDFYETCIHYENDIKYIKHLRRMWLVIK